MRGDSSKTEDRAINAKALILCEGRDERDILVRLRDAMGLKEDRVEVRSADGKDKIERMWEKLRLGSGGPSVNYLMLVLDSEDSAQQTQSWVQDFKSKHASESLRVEATQLPSGDEPGSVETAIRGGIPSTSPGHACATQWEACVQANPETKFANQARLDKAWLQVWLTHRTKSTASRIGYAVLHNNELYAELTDALQPLQDVLDHVLEQT